MKTIDIIFDDVDYCDELLGDISYWCETHGIPEDKVAVDYMEAEVDEVEYYVITVSESLFSYLMILEFDMTEKYGRDGWNGWVESNYNCEIV
jgi:hypothetical protein